MYVLTTTRGTLSCSKKDEFMMTSYAVQPLPPKRH